MKMTPFIMAIESFSNQKSTSTTRPTKRSVLIYETLRREIVLGLQPPRESLLELDLAKRFDCSQSPVREALLQLQQDGLVVRIANRGTQVADCIRDDMMELIRLRHDIECRGIERVVKQYNRMVYRDLTTLMEHMESAAQKEDEYQLSVLDQAFHLRIYEEANLPSVVPMLKRCLVHNHRYKILTTDREVPLLVTAQRHKHIIDALESGDTSVALEALSRHITTIVDFGPSILPISPGSSGRFESSE